MRAEELDRTLFGRLTFEQLADDAKTERTVSPGGAARLLDLLGRVALGEAQEADQDARPLDPSLVVHGLGPAPRVQADAPGLSQ